MTRPTHARALARFSAELDVVLTSTNRAYVRAAIVGMAHRLVRTVTRKRPARKGKVRK